MSSVQRCLYQLTHVVQVAGQAKHSYEHLLYSRCADQIEDQKLDIIKAQLRTQGVCVQNKVC